MIFHFSLLWLQTKDLTGERLHILPSISGVICEEARRMTSLKPQIYLSKPQQIYHKHQADFSILAGVCCKQGFGVVLRDTWLKFCVVFNPTACFLVNDILALAGNI